MSRIFPRGFIHPPAAPRKRNFCNGGVRCRFAAAPRLDIVWLHLAQPSDGLTRTTTESGHSRFPAAEGALDDILGVVDMDRNRGDRVLMARRRGDEDASAVSA